MTPPNMTPERIERDWLSLRYWLTRCVLPAAAVLLIVLGVMRLLIDDQSDLNHNALIVGFFALYFILVRGGHIIMMRSLHFELLRKYEDKYRKQLAGLPPESFWRRNLGFTLAQIKRNCLDESA